MENILHLEKICLQRIEADWLQQKNIELNVLRLDLIHPVISGNKWFKLRYYLEDAANKGFDTIATFGGAYSNHIIATAYACKMAGFSCLGIIRSIEPASLSHTLLTTQKYGMVLHFVSRTAYREKEKIKKSFKNAYWVNEGGYGNLGAKGAKDILSFCPGFPQFTHVICAVGTGTMMAGLIAFAQPDQQVIGISSMRGNNELRRKVKDLLSIEDEHKNYLVLHDFHFGGYAKHPPELIDFMNETWKQHHLPTDLVYTAKTFYAIQQLIMTDAIEAGSSVLMVHSGGLQGNDSLTSGTLLF